MPKGLLNINNQRFSSFWWWLSAAFIAVVLFSPLTVVLSSLFKAPGEGWELITEYLLVDYILGTIIMTLGVGLTALFLGVGSAWIITVWDFPCKRFFSLALMMPMAIPTYVMAFGYSFVKYDIRDPLMLFIKNNWGAVIMSQCNEIFNYGLAILILSFALYPYVYIAARVGFSEISGTYIENSRLLGRGLFRSMFSVGLPLARPAIVGGLLLAVLEVMNEYGAMTYYGIETLTTGIFVSWTDLGDKDSAVRLAAVAMVFVLLLIAIERLLRGRAKFHAHRSSSNNLSGPTRTNTGAVMAFLFCFILFTVSFALPVINLCIDTLHGWEKSKLTDLIQGPLIDSFIVSSIGCLGIVIAALVISYAARLFPTIFMKSITKLCMLGYAVPGAVVAISILVYFSGMGSFLSEFLGFGSLTSLFFTLTPAGLIIAYFVRFMTPALAPIEAGMIRINASMDEASSMLGRSSWGSFFNVHLPLLRFPLFGAMIVLFVDILKELPLTLVLRPPNIETLATTSYGLIQKEERIADGSFPALILVLTGTLAVLALHILIRKRIVNK
ncbi:MAG: iron ABC transporter permease [Verrucomicrobiaceae bacterium]|nr:iron ABC transporter permease [Verrucomicrobiaceae bacterium]